MKVSIWILIVIFALCPYSANAKEIDFDAYITSWGTLGNKAKFDTNLYNRGRIFKNLINYRNFKSAKTFESKTLDAIKKSKSLAMPGSDTGPLSKLSSIYDAPMAESNLRVAQAYIGLGNTEDAANSFTKFVLLNYRKRKNRIEIENTVGTALMKIHNLDSSENKKITCKFLGLVAYHWGKEATKDHRDWYKERLLSFVYVTLAGVYRNVGNFIDGGKALHKARNILSTVESHFRGIPDSEKESIELIGSLTLYIQTETVIFLLVTKDKQVQAHGERLLQLYHYYKEKGKLSPDCPGMKHCYNTLTRLGALKPSGQE